LSRRAGILGELFRGQGRMNVAKIRSASAFLCLPGAVLILLVLLVLSGCRKTPAAVAVIPRTTATMLWEPMHLGALETARQAGVRVYWNAPVDDGDTDKQLSLFDACRARGYRGFIFAPDETLAARSVVLQTIEKHIPVVVVDDELGPPPGPFLSYVENDEAAGVDLAAVRIAHLLPKGGVIAIIGISSHSESGVTREEEFEKALTRRAPAVRVAVRRFGDSIVTHQQQIAAQILAGDTPGNAPIDAIVALTAAATRGAFYAKIAASPHATANSHSSAFSHSVVPIVGFDQDMLLPVQTGDVDAVVIQNTREIGRIAMRNLMAEMNGSRTEGMTRVAPLLLTRQTINESEIVQLWQYADAHWSQP
jgi:ribose transport system substrate-binding protein